MYVPIDSGATDSSGTFVTASLSPGDYQIDVVKDGYFAGQASAWVDGPIEVSVPIEARSPGVLTVHVTEPDGITPVADANVVITNYETGDQVASGATNDSGMFLTSEPLQGGDYRIDVSKNGYDSGRDIVHLAGDTDSFVTLTPIVLGTLTVEALNQDTGGPITGATVTVRDYATWTVIASGTTDSAGLFTTTDGLLAGDYYVEVTADSYYAGSAWVYVSGDTSTTVWLEPRIPGTLTVEVLDQATNAPVADASVTVSYWDETTYETIIVATGTTGTDGTFTTASLEGRDYSVAARADGYYDGGTGVRVNGDTSTTVWLEPRIPGTLTVEVLDQATNAPVADASVTVRDYNTWEVVTTGSTDADGMFTTSTLAGGDYYVEATAGGYDGGSTWVFLKGETQATVWLVPDVPGSLAITLLDQKSDTSIADASVVVRNEDTGDVVASGTSDASGYFFAEPFDDGYYRVEFSAPGYFVDFTWVYIDGPTELSFTLLPRTPGILTVHVTDPDGTTPVPSAFVDVYDQDTGNRVGQGLTDANGSFATDTLPAGDYQVGVSRDGYFDGWTSERVSGPTDAYVWLDPRADGVLTVNVTDSTTSNPVDGASVTVRDSSTNDIVASGSTGADGVFITSEALPSNYYSIDVTKDGYFDGWTSYRVSGPTDAYVWLQPMADGVLTVNVTDSTTSNPVDGASVTVRDSSTNDIVASGSTGADGVFITSEALPGNYYSIDVTKDGYFDKSYSTAINGATELDVWLQPEAYSDVTVRVEAANGITAIPNAHVAISHYDSVLGQYIVDAEGNTDSDGAFMASSLRNGSYNVDVTADGYLSESTYVWIDGPTELSVAMDPNVGGFITTHVISRATGDPLADATVTISYWDETTYETIIVATGLTDENGVYVSDTPTPQGGGYQIDVTAVGYYSNSETLRVVGDTDAYLALEPRIPGTLTVEVLDQATNAPVAGASVTVRDSDTGENVATGATTADGTFTTGTLAGGDYYVEVTADGYYPSSYNWVYVSGDTSTTVWLEPRIPGTLTVEVLDQATNAPVADASVTVSYWDETTYETIIVATGTTGTDGTFTTASLEGRVYSVAARADGYYDGGTGVRVNGDTSTTVWLEPRIPGTLTVEVLDQATNAPVADASVTVRDYNTWEVVTTGSTDADGMFTTSTLAGGDYYVEVTADGYFGGGDWIHISGDMTTTVTLEPRIAGTVTITVADALTNAPIANVRVEISSWDARAGVIGTTDGNGKFISGVLPGGDYNVTVRADGYFATGNSFRLSGDMDRPLTIEPQVSGRLTIRVLDEASQDPVGSAMVTVRSYETFVVVASGTTDPDGTFVTGTLPGDHYYIEVAADNYYDGYGYATVAGDTDATVSISSQLPGTLTVEVTDQVTNTPITGASVAIRSTNDGGDVIGTTSSDGDFTTFEVLDGGTYEVTVSADGYDRTVRWHTINGDTIVPIALRPTTDGVVTVHAVIGWSDPAMPVEGASVVLTSRVDGQTIIGTTNESGVFITAGVIPGGEYDIDVTADGYYPAQGFAKVVGDTETGVQLQPKVQNELSLTVMEEITYAPIAGATVTIWSGDPFADPYLVGTTEADGTFRSGLLPADQFWFRVDAGGYFSSEIRTARPTTGDFIDWPVTLKPIMDPRIVNVTVVDAMTNEPIPGTSVSVEWSNFPYKGGLLDQGITDTTGTFVSHELSPYRYWVWVTADGYLPRVGPDSIEADLYQGDANITVELVPESTVFQSHVTLSVAPDVDGTYTLTAPDATKTSGTISQGLADLGMLSYGEGYSIEVHGNGYVPVTLQFSISTVTTRLEASLTEPIPATLSLTVSEGEAGTSTVLTGYGFAGGETVVVTGPVARCCAALVPARAGPSRGRSRSRPMRRRGRTC